MSSTILACLLTSADNAQMFMSGAALELCVHLKKHVETSGEDKIQVNIRSETLQAVVRWCEHHKNGMDTHDWDKEFFNVESETIVDIYCAADTLGIFELKKQSMIVLSPKMELATQEEKLRILGLTYSIQSKDGLIFHLTEGAAKLSRFMNNSGVSLNNRHHPIQIDILSKYLELICKWCECHNKLDRSSEMFQLNMELSKMESNDLMDLLCASDTFGVMELTKIIMKILSEKVENLSQKEKFVAYGLTYKLQSEDGFEFHLTEMAAKQTTYFKDLTTNNKDAYQLNILGSHLEIIVNWLEYHQNTPPGIVTPYDKKMLSCMEWDDIQSVCLHSSELGINRLYNMTMDVVVDMYKSGRLDKNLDIIME